MKTLDLNSYSKSHSKIEKTDFFFFGRIINLLIQF